MEGKSVSDSGQLLQQIIDEDVLDPFEDVGDGGKHPREDRLGDETHRLRKLVRQQRQQSRATTKASREQDEERQFLEARNESPWVRMCLYTILMSPWYSQET